MPIIGRLEGASSLEVKRARNWLGWLALCLTGSALVAAPIITVEPLPALTQARTILIHGSTAPHSELTVSLGGQTMILRLGDRSRFEIGPLELAEGQNVLVIIAKLDGETSRFTCTIAADRQAPPLRLDPPWDQGSPAVTSPQPQTIRGRTEPGCTVAIKLGEQQFDAVPAGQDGVFEVQLLGDLPDGVQPLVLVATDPAGNETRIERELAIDGTPPSLTLDPPLDQDFATALRTLALRGVAEPGARLRVRLNDEPKLLTSITDEGRFALLGLQLKPGPNDLVIEAVDAVGNQTFATRKVVYDTTSPDLYLASPLDQPVYRTATPALKVTGQAEAGAEVLLRTSAGLVRRVTADDQGRFDAGVLLLVEGTTDVVCTARDAAGNATMLRRWVAVDRQPPPIQLTSPGPLPYVETETLILAGRTEPGVLLVLRRGGDEERVVADERGAFMFDELKLQDGLNGLVLTATDGMGNARILPIDVLARLQPLWLRVTEPDEGWQSATPTRLALVTEADARLSATLDGQLLGPWHLSPPKQMAARADQSEDAIVAPAAMGPALADLAVAEDVPWRAALADLPELAPGPHVLVVEASSPSGLRTASVRRPFHVPGTPRSMVLWSEAGSQSTVRCQAFDDWEQPVADGTIIEVRAPQGWLIGDREVARLRTVHGEVQATLVSSGRGSGGVVLVSVGRLTESLRIGNRSEPYSSATSSPMMDPNGMRH